MNGLGAPSSDDTSVQTAVDESRSDRLPGRGSWKIRCSRRDWEETEAPAKGHQHDGQFTRVRPGPG